MKYSTTLFAFLFISFPLFVSCIFTNQKIIYGNYQLVNKQIAINNYDQIILNIPAEVFYQQFSDSAPYLQIHTDENILKALDVRIENNQLILEAKKDSIIKPSMLTIYTSSHNLDQVKLAGSGKIRLKGEVNGDKIKFDITGSGNMIADSLICNTTEVRITGSGDAQLSGASSRSSYTITGSGNVYAFDYFVQDLNCIITGSGKIEALVINQLETNLTGSGSLFYRGNPQTVNNKIVGSGKVQRVE